MLFVVSIHFLSCSEADKPVQENEISNDSTDVWYKQADIELGSKVKMFSSSSGIAVSRGRGDIRGNAYKFEDGKWNSFFNFPYSDFPLIGQYDSAKIWVVNHLTHTGHFKPVLTEINGETEKKIDIPTAK